MVAHRVASEKFGGEGDKDAIGEICQFLSTLLVLQGTVGIQDVREKVLGQLKKWRLKYRGKFTEKSSDRCITILEPTG